jgi:hypothetical protein
MAYMNADTTAKVGFRPYRQTDPYAASQLSGLGFVGTYHLNRPFDPWELYGDVHETAGLHGLGQQHPFKPTAWQLHGLGDVDQVTTNAVQELQSAGSITPDEAQAILSGSQSFTDVLGFDPTDQAHWYDLVSIFQSVNQSLLAMETAYAAAGPQPGNMAWVNFGKQLQANRTQYSDLASKFIHYYTLVIGSAPAGLSGLGIAPIIFVAGAIVFVVTATIILYGLRDWSKTIDVNQLKAQTQQQQASTDQVLAQQLAAAQAAGDTVTANTIAAALGTRAAASGTTPDATSWLLTNAKWIGLGAAGLIVLGPLSEGLFGKRRR